MNFTTQTSNGNGGCTSCCVTDATQLDQPTVSDAAGHRQVLYTVNGGRPLNIGLKKMDMPPLPPHGIFDARFESGKLVELINENSAAHLKVKLQGAVYPVALAWNSKRDNVTAYQLQQPGNGLKSLSLNAQGSISLNNSTESIDILPNATRGCPPQSETASKGIDLSLAKAGSPGSYALRQNAPNPFNPTTIIYYDLPQDTHVRLSVYNMLGQEIRGLVDEMENAGYKSVVFNASNVPSGVYLYRIQTRTFNDVKKLVFMK
jgi:hypothetical protein